MIVVIAIWFILALLVIASAIVYVFNYTYRLGVQRGRILQRVDDSREDIMSLREINYKIKEGNKRLREEIEKRRRFSNYF